MRAVQTCLSWSPSRPLLRRLLYYRGRFTQSGGFAMAEATEALEVSDRTVYRDMDFVRTLDWDVTFSRKSRRWELASPGAPLPMATLREGEWVALLVAEEALRSYRGTPYAEALETAFSKLTSLLDTPVTLRLSEGSLPRFTTPPARAVDACQLRRLAEACRGRRCLRITYASPERGELTTRRIDPYHLFAHAGDWYLVAYDYLRDRYTTFALGERMRSVEDLAETYTPDPDFELDRYLAEGFGLFRGGPVEEVVLKFSPSVAPYLREKVWDETERKEGLPDGSLLLTMRVPVNVGLLRFVLQYGPEVRVLAPRCLQEQIARAHREAWQAYEEASQC